MTRIQANTRALLELEQIFDDMLYTACGSFLICVKNAHVECHRLMGAVHNQDYFETITAMEFAHGLSSSRWDKLINNCTERIYLQCQRTEELKP